MTSTYEQFVKAFNVKGDPYKCINCGSEAVLCGKVWSARPGEFRAIRQYCLKEKLSRKWRDTELSIMDKHQSKYLRDNKLILVPEAAAILKITPTYLRNRIHSKQVPFVSVAGRIYIEGSRMEDIKMFFERVKKHGKKVGRKPNAVNKSASGEKSSGSAKAA